MRRATLLLLALSLLATVADGKVVMVSDQVYQRAGDYAECDARSGRWTTSTLCGILDAWGVDYDLVPHAKANVRDLRLGYYVAQAGDTVAFDALIIPRFYRCGPSADYCTPTRARFSSLTRGDSVPKVPTLAFLGGLSFLNYPACSTGAKSAPTGGSGSGGDNDYFGHECEKAVYAVSRNDLRYYYPGVSLGAILDATRPAGGVRGVVAYYTPAVPVQIQERGEMPSNIFAPQDTTNGSSYFASEGWAGPTARYNQSDSCMIWVRTNAHVTGAKPMIFSTLNYPDIETTCTGENQDEQALAFDVVQAAQAIAYLDSVSGGKVIGTKDAKRENIKLCITIDGAFRSGPRASATGICTEDSLNLIAAIDTLASYGVPFVVGCQPDADSLSTSEKSWWLRAPKARFAPQRDWTSEETPDTTAAEDFWLMDRTFGRNRTSRFILPLSDNWVSTLGADSTAEAFRGAGAVGIRTSSRDSIAGGKRIRGWYHGLKMLPHSGTLPYGSEKLQSLPTSDEYTTPLCNRVLGSWTGIFCPAVTLTTGQDATYVTEKYGQRPNTRTYVLSIPAQALSGSQDGSDGSVEGQATGNPLRPGLWWIISMIRSVEATNALAGRTVISFGYPEEINP